MERLLSTANAPHHNSEGRITAKLVPDRHRMGFLLQFFRPHNIIRGEHLTFDWMRALCSEYGGGMWHFYTLSNGGYYMAPDLEGRLPIVWHGKGYSGEMSADAAGVVATLYALCQLAGESQEERLADLYHLLREHACDHQEAREILAAID